MANPNNPNPDVKNGDEDWVTEFEKLLIEGQYSRAKALAIWHEDVAREQLAYQKEYNNHLARGEYGSAAALASQHKDTENEILAYKKAGREDLAEKLRKESPIKTDPKIITIVPEGFSSEKGQDSLTYIVAGLTEGLSRAAQLAEEAGDKGAAENCRYIANYLSKLDTGKKPGTIPK